MLNHSDPGRSIIQLCLSVLATNLPSLTINQHKTLLTNIQHEPQLTINLHLQAMGIPQHGTEAKELEVRPEMQQRLFQANPGSEPSRYEWLSN